MKKANKFFSLMLCFLLCVGMLSIGTPAAMAAGEAVQVGRVDLADGEYTVDGLTKSTEAMPSTGYAHYKNGVLTLNNFVLDRGGANDSIIYFSNNLEINIIGENTLTTTSPGSYRIENAILVEADCKIYGNGTLNINLDSQSSAIAGKGGASIFTIQDIALNIYSDKDESYGILNMDTLILQDVTLNMSVAKCAYNCGILNAEDSVITAVAFDKDNALFFASGVSVNNCYVYAKGLTGLGANDYGTVSIGTGHYILEGFHNYYSALCANEDTLQLPATYYYRTSKDANFTKGDLAYTQIGIKYIEIYTEGWNIPVEIEWPVDTSFTYDGTKKTVTARIINKADGDAVELVLSGNQAVDVGDYTATVIGLAGKDAAKYTLNGGQNLTHAWKITQSVPSYTVPTGLTATYGQTLADITLPEGFAWQDASTTSVGNVGTNTFKATFTPADPVNYQTVTDIDVTIIVGKALPTIATKPTASSVVAGGKLSDSALTGGVANGVDGTALSGTFAWKDGTLALDTAGTAHATVIFTPNNENYDAVEFEIAVAVYTPTVTPPTGDHSNLFLCMALLLISGIGIAVLAGTKRWTKSLP